MATGLPDPKWLRQAQAALGAAEPTRPFLRQVEELDRRMQFPALQEAARRIGETKFSISPEAAEEFRRATEAAIPRDTLRMLRTPRTPLISPEVFGTIERQFEQNDRFRELRDRLQAINTVAWEAAEEAEVPAEPVPEAEAEQGRTWLVNLPVAFLIVLLQVALGAYDEAKELAERVGDSEGRAIAEQAGRLALDLSAAIALALGRKR